MPVEDYEKVKKLDVDSVSGTPTVGKAQPILLVGGDDSTTGNGDIILDWSNISDAQDVAVYDQNGNLLDYEIESLDTTAETGVLWAYNSWVRDGTTQAQIAYGANSANTDRQNVTATWDNTGQNTVMVQHFQHDPLTATDSTANNNDGTVNGAVSTTGEFDGAASFDGNDDYIDTGTLDVFANGNTSDLTIVTFFNTDDTANNRLISRYGAANWTWIYRLDGSGDTLRALVAQSDGSVVDATTSFSTTNQWFHSAMTYSTELNLYVDGVSQASATGDGTLRVSPDYQSAIGARPDNVDNWDGELDAFRIYSDEKSSAWMQADYDASPKAGQVFFSQQAAEPTLSFDGVTTTASASGTGETTSLSGTTTVNTITANADGSGATIFVEPDFATLSANGIGTGETISISGQTTITNLETANADGTSVDTLNLKPSLLFGEEASATGSGETISTDRLQGTVDVEGQPTSGVDVNVIDKTNNILYETTTDSNGDWIVDSGDGILYQVAYLFDDGSTYYGDAEESDTR